LLVRPLLLIVVLMVGLMVRGRVVGGMMMDVVRR
jgi:hypothetical protein